MKPRIIIVLFLLSITLARAQDVNHLSKKYSVAVSFGQFGYDTGLGIEFGSPAFFNRFHVRIRANKTWLESYNTVHDHWATYNLIGASMVYRVATIERCLVYTEIGVHAVFPSIKFSEVSHVQGVSSLLGVNLFVIYTPDVALSYFFSGGIGYTNAYAEKLERSPRYASGFLFTNGFRFYF